MKYRNNAERSSEVVCATDTFKTRLAALPFPLIALIILLMCIAKYFG
ncbi:MAG TPA: hypothetical protein VFC63_17230 [Blastocatellia bacterium]|nr:hypothetical protein [Blastocatellia bacterium]